MKPSFDLEDKIIAIIGLGYVGLPLAVSFSKKYKVIAFDIDQSRIDELLLGNDRTLEIKDTEFLRNKNLHFTYEEKTLGDADVYIVTVPTPIKESKEPDLKPLVSASELIGKHLTEGNCVIYESTVYPGVTEEICAPILTSFSNLTLNKGYYLGYSPERINPGDDKHTFENITKIVSGSNPDATYFINKLYASILKANTHISPSIKVAEAAKVIENIQRDINIALVNELSMLFEKMNIDTESVLSAAATKWNFLNFKPGLVGGHCIGVDPYYLAFKAKEIGFHAEMIESGRRINDQYPKFIVEILLREVLKEKINPITSEILLLGYTFKENCPDIRNTKVFNIVEELFSLKFNIDVVDPWARDADRTIIADLVLKKKIPNKRYDVIIGAVAHDDFISISEKIVKEHSKKTCIILDVKNIFKNCPDHIKHISL